jgi:hypothetical protein
VRQEALAEGRAPQVAEAEFHDELKLEQTQTHMAQKPMLQVEDSRRFHNHHVSLIDDAM